MSIETDKLCQAVYRVITQGLVFSESEMVIDAVMELIDEVEFDGKDPGKVATAKVKTLAPVRLFFDARDYYKRELVNREAQYRSDKRKYG